MSQITAESVLMEQGFPKDADIFAFKVSSRQASSRPRIFKSSSKQGRVSEMTTKNSGTGNIQTVQVKFCRSQWPRDLRRRSAAACLLRL
jgi:hypothetical protein